jgi:hypothetical protein
VGLAVASVHRNTKTLTRRYHSCNESCSRSVPSIRAQCSPNQSPMSLFTQSTSAGLSCGGPASGAPARSWRPLQRGGRRLVPCFRARPQRAACAPAHQGLGFRVWARTKNSGYFSGLQGFRSFIPEVLNPHNSGYFSGLLLAWSLSRGGVEGSAITWCLVTGGERSKERGGGEEDVACGDDEPADAPTLRDSSSDWIRSWALSDVTWFRV